MCGGGSACSKTRAEPALLPTGEGGLSREVGRLRRRREAAGRERERTSVCGIVMRSEGGGVDEKTRNVYCAVTWERGSGLLILLLRGGWLVGGVQEGRREKRKRGGTWVCAAEACVLGGVGRARAVLLC